MGFRNTGRWAPQRIMAFVRRLRRALLVGLLPLAACSTTRPEWLQQEEDACFRQRGFTEEILG